MFSKNLRFYRLKKSLTQEDLAEKTGLTAAAISDYENGELLPDMATIKKLASELDIRITDFLEARNTNLVFQHSEPHYYSSLF